MATDKEVLEFIKGRMVNVYGESPNVDYIHSLDRVIRKLDGRQAALISADSVISYIIHREPNSVSPDTLEHLKEAFREVARYSR